MALQFSHQTKHFVVVRAFFLHDNSVLAPLKPQIFETITFFTAV